MDDEPSEGMTRLAKLALLLIVVLVIAGVIWRGVSTEQIARIWTHLFERPGGPMTFRFILQPAMGAIAALHDGVRDARAGRKIYLWRLLTEPHARGRLLGEGLGATARIILLGLGMDLVYQITVFGTFYPVEAVDIAILLAFVPYLLLRGLMTLIARHWVSRPKTERPGP